MALAWSVVHTMFTTRYARLYYTGVQGGIDFKEDDPPKYSDFAYLAFTTWDDLPGLQTVQGHRPSARLLSYLFVVVIIATMINLVAGLSKEARSAPNHPSPGAYEVGDAAPRTSRWPPSRRRVQPRASRCSSSGMATRRVVVSACRASLVVNGWGRVVRTRIARAGVTGSRTTSSASRRTRPARSAAASSR